MRTYQDMLADLDAALAGNAIVELQMLADEFQALGTREAEALALHARGMAHDICSAYASAMDCCRSALTIFQDLGDRQRTARVTNALGIIALHVGDHGAALVHFREALALHDEMNDHTNAASVICNIGNVFLGIGDYPAAMEQYRRALSIYEDIGNDRGIALVVGNLASVYGSCGDYATALEHVQRALPIHRAHGDIARVAQVTSSIGNAYLGTLDYGLALQYFQEAMAMHAGIGDRASQAAVACNIGIVHHRLGDHASAMEHYGVSCAIYAEIKDTAGLQRVEQNMVALLLDERRYEEAGELIARRDSIQHVDPLAHASHLANRARLAEARRDVDAAWNDLCHALTIVTDVGVRSWAADYHLHLRELAQQRNDFAGYIEHNTAYLRITEEIRGKDATQRIAMLEAEKKISAERAEKERHKALLYNTLPPSIADRVLRGEVVNDALDRATVMFVDMVGFTSMSSAMDPSDVVQLLNEIFSSFDAIVAEHDLMKIKTIGDSYMAVGFPNSEQRVASAALAILHMVTIQYPQIKIRIGVHCGPVTAGVIGTERLQYDVWGDTVNVASRMESTGEPGRIHVSEAFARQLTIDPLTAASLTLSARGMVEVKGKGPMQTFWLDGAHSRV